MTSASESTPTPSSPPNPTRDAEYYLETVVFQVENSVFKVPRFQFEHHSEIFATTFTLPPAAGGKAEGSKKNPFKLEGISCVDFKSFLKVLYPLAAVPITPTLLKEEWISVLILATLWQFLEIRELAIKALTSHVQSMDCIERILLGKEYDISIWLRSGYADLARREAAISLEEATKIGWEVTLLIYQCREAALKAGYPVAHKYLQKVDVESAFREIFQTADAASAVYKRVNDPAPPPAPTRTIRRYYYDDSDSDHLPYAPD